MFLAVRSQRNSLSESQVEEVGPEILLLSVVAIQEESAYLSLFFKVVFILTFSFNNWNLSNFPKNSKD